MSDLDLLDQYARDNRQDAFAALLDRHLKLVYSAALRQVRSPELAQEIAQSVFCDLANAAGKLQPDTLLTAWLYHVTRRRAIDVIRRESRRQLREKTAQEMNHTTSNSTEWTAIEPVLEEAMESLDPSDRAAILLRFFEDKSLREVGAALGTSEDTAQKRVSRALDHLRQFFSRRGHAVGAVSLAAVISANAVKAAPAGLKTTILHAATSGVLAPAAGVAGVTKTIAMTTLQKTVVCVVLAAAVGAGFYERERASVLQTELQSQQAKTRPGFLTLPAANPQLDDANRKLAMLQSENEKLRSNAAELARLRNEVTRLRASNQPPAVEDATSNSAASWISRVKQLKQRVQQTPASSIPEFKYLTERDWLDVARGDLNSEDDYRTALAGLRTAAENSFIRSDLQPALRKFAQANNGQFPVSLDQLQNYFDSPVDPAILARWQLAPRAVVPSVGVGDSMITQIAPVDAEFDLRMAIGPNGWGSTSGAQAWDAKEPVKH